MKTDTSRVFSVTDNQYEGERALWRDVEHQNRVILAKNRKGAGSLAYFTNSAVPVFLPDFQQTENIEYADARDLRSALPGVVDRVARIDGYRAQLGRMREFLHWFRTKNPRGVVLKLIPTTVCGMACGYCYAGKHEGNYDKVNFDFGKMRHFFSQHGHKLGRVIVYGGDSLMQPGLASLLRECLPDTSFSFVTGMGYPTPVFHKKAREVLSVKGHFTFSIDPPVPGRDKPYTRVYKLYPGDNGHQWYDELLKRAGDLQAWFNETTQSPVEGAVWGGTRQFWGVRPTITQHGFDFRKLREDLKNATGVDEVPINMEPASGGLTPGGADDMEMLNRIDHLLDLDVDDILDQKLSLRSCQYFRDKLAGILNPARVFSPGGCYDYFTHLSLGPRGELSFCNEAPTYDPDQREPWMFGNYLAGDVDGYVRVMNQVYKRPEKCRKCDHRFTCGTHCPIKILKDEGDGCMFSRIMSEKVLQIAANVDSPEIFHSATLEARLQNLERWGASEPLSREEIEDHARWLLAPA